MIIDKKELLISHVPICWFAGEEGDLLLGLPLVLKMSAFEIIRGYTEFSSQSAEGVGLGFLGKLQNLS